MSQDTTLSLFVKGNADIVDATLSKSDGGAKLDEGVRELISERFPAVSLNVSSEPAGDFAALRQELETGGSTMIDTRPDIVVLSIAEEVRGLPRRGANAEEAVRAVKDDLVAAIELIKERVGAHVLVANASTIDPTVKVRNYHGLPEEPISLRVHRLDLMLVGVSHERGISIIDVDRVLAELGADGNMDGPLSYGPRACDVIARETARILEEYGFFDDRPVLAQVGAKGQTA